MSVEPVSATGRPGLGKRVEEAAPKLRQGNPYDDALVAAVQRARAQMDAGAVGPEMGGKVEELVRDQEMLVRLETARLQSAAGNKETGFDYAGADKLYMEAFQWYGLDVTTLDSREASERIQRLAIRTHVVAALDYWAMVKNELHREAGASLVELAERTDDDPWRQRMREAVKRFDRAEVAKLAEEAGANQSPADLVQLAGHLKSSGNIRAAEQLLRRSQASHPSDFWINFNLASILETKKPADLTDTVRYYQAALAGRPESPVVWSNLGNVLAEHGKLTEAVAAQRQAIHLQPNYAAAYSNLGKTLRVQGKLTEAIEAYRTAIALRPNLAVPYTNLGNALGAQGKFAEAETVYRKAVELQPEQAEFHYNLGLALGEQKKLAEAEAAYKKAIELQRDFAEAYCNLGNVLLPQGHFADALAALQRGHELGTKRDGWSYPSGQWVRVAQQWVGLDEKLPKFLSGEIQTASGVQWLALARICGQYRKQYGAAARFFAAGFAAQPDLADDLRASTASTPLASPYWLPAARARTPPGSATCSGCACAGRP